MRPQRSPVNVTSLKNASPLAVVTPLRRAAGGCACRPGVLFSQSAMRLVKAQRPAARLPVHPVRYLPVRDQRKVKIRRQRLDPLHHVLRFVRILVRHQLLQGRPFRVVCAEC